MPVNTTSKQYEEMSPYWTFVRNIISDKERLEYIHPLESTIGLNETTNEYRRMLYRNQLYIYGGVSIGATKLTIRKLVGLFADKKSKFELGKQLEYLKENCTGTGVGLQEFCEKSLAEVETVSRIGVLMDYPQTGGKRMTRDELKRYGVLPRFYRYNAESIISCKVDTLFGTEVQTQIVLKEQIEVPVEGDEFAVRKEDQYRVLRLRKQGYTQQLYGQNNQPSTEEVLILNGKGKSLQYIPFFVCNSEENGANNMNEPPVLGMAKLDQAYLQDSCSHKRYVKYAGAFTLWFTTSHDTKQWIEANPNGQLQMGSDAFNLGQQGEMSAVNAPETSAHLVAMEHTIDLMCMAGAALINGKTAAPKTAFEILQTMSAEVSPLHRAVSNVEEMIKTLVDWAADMIESDFTKINHKDIVIDLNKVFITEGKDTELMRVELEGRHDKVTSLKRVRDNWKKRYGMIPEDISDEELDKEIAEEEHKLGLDMDEEPAVANNKTETANEKDTSNDAVG